MKPSIDRLIENASDDELCRAVLQGLDREYGIEMDAKEFSNEARVVILAVHASGLIGNGGFGYLFEGDFPGDPGFRLMLQAFETLGVKPATAAFKKALAVFPNSRPPKSIRKRLDVFQSVPYWHRQKINEEFWSASDDITKELAQYIRDHREAFSHLRLKK